MTPAPSCRSSSPCTSDAASPAIHTIQVLLPYTICISLILPPVSHPSHPNPSFFSCFTLNFCLPGVTLISPTQCHIQAVILVSKAVGVILLSMHIRSCSLPSAPSPFPPLPVMDAHVEGLRDWYTTRMGMWDVYLFQHTCCL